MGNVVLCHSVGSVIPGGPAYQSGITAGVVIVQVGDKDVRYCNHDEVVALIAESGRGLSLAIQVHAA
jgi:C-terminal processing protease CtpA/Prc